MSDNVVYKTTADYIVGSRENLELAFAVEQAMPVVRERAATEMIKAVKARLEALIDKTLWEVYISPTDTLYTKAGCMVLRKPEWPKTFEDWPMGVGLYTDSSIWRRVYLGVICFPQDAQYDSEKLKEAAREVYGAEPGSEEPETGEPVWWPLTDSSTDWHSLEFLKIAVDKPARLEKAADLADRILVIAEAVAPVFIIKHAK